MVSAIRCVATANPFVGVTASHATGVRDWRVAWRAPRMVLGPIALRRWVANVPGTELLGKRWLHGPLRTRRNILKVSELPRRQTIIFLAFGCPQDRTETFAETSLSNCLASVLFPRYPTLQLSYTLVSYSPSVLFTR